ncbi:MAG: 3-isopropylmalate dehydratase small subunit [Solirubrobacteraceae bacterium]|nr:3-isopropylmalate dehydratase small subunit [Solirubrobacteraceae bacterium]
MSAAPIEGRVVRLGDDVDTDVLLPGAYLNVTDPAELGRHLLEGYDPEVAARVQAGDVVVAGRNMGCGSSREHAVLALRARGVQAVVAESFARIFLRNCLNLGLPAVEHPAAARALADGERVRIDLGAGTVEGERGRWELPPQPPFLTELLRDGGLVPWVRRRLHAHDRER